MPRVEARASFHTNDGRWARSNDWHGTMGFWDFLLWIFWVFVFVAYLMVVFSIIADIFRDHALNGWLKAIWILFLIFVPFLTALIYLIARGSGMQKRSLAQAQEIRDAILAFRRDGKFAVAFAETFGELGDANPKYNIETAFDSK